MSFDKGEKRRFKLTYLAIILFFFFPSQSWAYGGDSPVNQSLHYWIDQALGAPGLSLLTISFITVGILCLCRIVEWSWLYYLALGSAFIFGAPAMALGLRSLF